MAFFLSRTAARAELFKLRNYVIRTILLLFYRIDCSIEIEKNPNLFYSVHTKFLFFPEVYTLGQYTLDKSYVHTDKLVVREVELEDRAWLERAEIVLPSERVCREGVNVQVVVAEVEVGEQRHVLKGLVYHGPDLIVPEGQGVDVASQRWDHLDQLREGGRFYVIQCSWPIID